MKTMTHKQMLDEYLARVSTLFAQARQWTSEIDPNATFEEQDVSLTEEPVGPYSANELIIKCQDLKPIRLIPRGRWIIGAEGRVDMKSNLGTKTLVYTSEGGPHVKIDTLTENGRILERGKPRPVAKDITEGWVLVQNRQLGMLPSLDADLFCRLLEVLGR